MRVGFVGWQPPVPAGRSFQLWDMIGEKNRNEDTTGDLARFISLFQEVTDLVLYDIDRFTQLADPDLAQPDAVEAMLDDLGDPFTEFDLDTIDQRRLVHLLVAIYQEKGTNDGMINAVRFFMGLEITIDEIGFGTWVLGKGSGSALGVNSVLGTSDPATLNTFDVVVSTNITAAQVAQVEAICQYMRPAWTHLRNVVQPSTAPVFVPWVLGRHGYSFLGVNCILHD